jgi:hypothetical protein
LKWPSLEDRFSAAMSLTRLDRGLVREAVPYVVDFYRQTKLSGNRAGIAELLGDADYPQYKTFMKRADRAFVLRTPARPDVTGAVSLSFYTQRSEGLREIEVVIPAEEFKRMEAGVAYTPAPVNGKPGFEWAVKDGVTVTKPAG